MYLSPTTSETVLSHGDVFGILESPRTKRNITGWIEKGFYWAYDNDAFTGFDEDAWLEGLDRHEQFRSSCVFIVCPDYLGDKVKTLERFEKYYPVIEDWPVAFVTQDGTTSKDLPWEHITAVFVGGTDKHKLGAEAGAIIREAEIRQKWIHVGRVNSKKRMMKFWRANSWDGTTLAFEPSGADKIARTVRQIRTMQKQEELL